jgi:hypothetical protein
MDKAGEAINILADNGEPIVLVPLIVVPVQIQVPLVGIAPEIRSIPVI